MWIAKKKKIYEALWIEHWRQTKGKKNAIWIIRSNWNISDKIRLDYYSVRFYLPCTLTFFICIFGVLTGSSRSFVLCGMLSTVCVCVREFLFEFSGRKIEISPKESTDRVNYIFIGTHNNTRHGAKEGEKKHVRSCDLLYISRKWLTHTHPKTPKNLLNSLMYPVIPSL